MSGVLPRSMVALILSSSLLAALPGPSIAATPVPEDFSAADQYVESIPTSEGSKPAERGRRGGTRKPSSGTGTGTGSRDSGNEQLEQAAASLDSGAPRQRLRSGKVEEPAVPTAVVSAVDEGGGGRHLLLLSLLLVSGVVAGTAGHRHYRNRHLTRDD